MANLSVDLDKIASEADAIAQTIRVKKLSDALGKVVDATNSAAKAWSGSWLGYHSRIYYKDLKPIPPGARFDPSHGFQDRYLSGTHGDWAEYTFDGIYETLKSAVSASTFQSLLDASEAAKPKIRDLREELLSAMAE